MQPATEGNPHRDTSTSTLYSLHLLFNNIFIMQMCVYKLYSVLVWLVFEQVACLGVKYIINYTENIII